MKKKNIDWIYVTCAVLFAAGIFWVLHSSDIKRNPPRKEYAFLKAEVMYGKLPPNTAKVSKCFERFVGYRAVFCGKVYFITGTTGRNPFSPEHIYFSGNANIKIYNKRLIPVFRSGTIIDKIEEEK